MNDKRKGPGPQGTRVKEWYPTATFVMTAQRV